MTNNPISRFLLEGRILRILRMLLLVPTFYLMWTAHEHSAAVFLGAVTLLGWFNTFQLRYLDVEEPFTHLWFSFVEGLLTFALMVNILIRNVVKDYDFPWILTVGCLALLARVVAHTLYGLSVVREGKPLRKSFWGRAASISITLTLMIYVLDI